MTTAEKPNYKKTLNLPKTAFSMKANLVQNEPASQKRWSKMKLYEQVREAKQGATPFWFHDGPPYANGSIHLGHLLNKVMKDFVVRSKTMAGFDVPYIPGWDCHGLPIEHRVMQDLAESMGDDAKTMEPIAIRRKCKSYADKQIKLQRKQMERLLTMADYDHPYLTMLPAYEGAVLEVFAEMVSKGLVYRGLKPVHWSVDNQTALAEAELEYYDRDDTSVYVLFELDKKLDAVCDATHVMIWTTTPWTLPANLGVAVQPRAEYGVYDVNGKQVILAVELASKVLAAEGVEASEPKQVVIGSDLVGLTYKHPFINDERSRPVVTADYVTLEDGTGLVHTAPGHGVEDYQTGLRENLDIYCPVLADGTYDNTVPDWLQGVSIWQANQMVVDRLVESGHMFHHHQFNHSYPHDWRSKSPVIFRATEQWFVDVNKAFDCDGSNDSVKDRALATTADNVAFYPAWGKNRMRGMLETRPDWCLSRQRAWGLPIPAFYADGEAEPLLTEASVLAVAQLMREKGSDVWFLAEPADLLVHYDASSDSDAPAWVAEALANKQESLKKSTDIFDVWFESGSSWHAVMRQRFTEHHAEHPPHPCDLYLEGSDQHRGWFQLSLLPSLAVTGKPPFKAVLTHGFMVNKDGKKLSKSAGDSVDDLFQKYGADVLRWWVSTLNTDNDIKVDDEFFKLAGEEYRKVRNTLRFILSNLDDFDVNEHGHTFTEADAVSIDAWALDATKKLATEVQTGYDGYAFRKVSAALFKFCNETMSAEYLTATKDRLYCDKVDSPRRRRTQTALYRIAETLCQLLAPVLPHTADEAYQALKGKDICVHTTTLADSATLCEVEVDDAWLSVMDSQRDTWLKAMEETRQAEGIDNPLDLGLNVSSTPELAKLPLEDLADVCGVSRFEFTPGSEDHEAINILDLRNEPRCDRSWKRDGTVTERSDGGLLTDRDANALGLT